MVNELISRECAIANSFKRYFTGVPCSRGHVSERATVNSTCVECSKAAKKAAHARDPSIAIARRRANYAKNPEGQKAVMREYYRAAIAADPGYNRETYAATRVNRIAASLRWSRENPAARRAQHAKRKAAQRNAVPCWYSEFDEFVMIEAAGLALQRQRITGYAWHIDHMIPLQAKEACGLHCASNVQVIPGGPNISKNNRMMLTEPGEWLRLL